MGSKINIPLLTSEDIEVKIKQVSKTGALALLYKTARVDRRILNEVFGQFNWCSDFRVIDDNLYCGIGIRESKEDEFVYKWEAGGDTDNPLDGGTKAKANASDAFKRAGFAVGIGEELYSSPYIWLEVATEQRGDKWFLKDPYAKYVVTHIAYNEKTRVITELEISNAKTDVKVFSWKLATTGAMAKKMVNTLAVEEPTEDAAPEAVEESANETANAETQVKKAKKAEKKEAGETVSVPFNELISLITEKVKEMYSKDGNVTRYKALLKEVTGAEDFKCSAATEEQYDLILKIYTALDEMLKGENG